MSAAARPGGRNGYGCRARERRRGAVGRAFTFIQFRADQDVDHQSVRHVHAPDLARGQCGMAAEFADDMNRVLHLCITCG